MSLFPRSIFSFLIVTFIAVLLAISLNKKFSWGRFLFFLSASCEVSVAATFLITLIQKNSDLNWIKPLRLFQIRMIAEPLAFVFFTLGLIFLVRINIKKSKRFSIIKNEVIR